MAVSIGGLVAVKNGSDLKKEDDAQKIAAIQKELEAKDMGLGVATRLAGAIRKEWYKNRRFRFNMNHRLLACLRARLGKYSESQMQMMKESGGADPVYLKLTGTKCRAASSWVRDILIPAGDRSWEVDPTPQADLPGHLEDSLMASVKQEAMALAQQGMLENEKDAMDFFEKSRDKVKEEIQKQAVKRARRAEVCIEDMMAEGGWDEALDEFIEDFVTYPTAFLKGPYTKQMTSVTWGAGDKPIIKTSLGVCWKRISPFDMYPDPHARSTQDGSLIEHLRLTPRTLYEFIGVEGYDEKEIRTAITEFQEGSLRDWIWEDFERERLETDSPYFISDHDMIDALHFWGYVTGDMLQDWGIKSASIERERSYHIDAILVGHRVIRAVINGDPRGLRPYHSACWDAVPGSLWGIALPEQMDDHQKIVNACARALCNNMSLASGPQIVVMNDMLAEGEDPTGIYPMKIWQAKSSITGNSGKPVDFFQPDTNAQELLSVLDNFEKRADDVTNVPRYSYGNERVGGAGNTATGLSMLLNAAAKGIRRAISNVDKGVFKPSLTQTYDHLMATTNDPTIKGDCKIVARGSAAILIKEQAQMRRQTVLAQTANPIDMQIFGIRGRAELWREFFQFSDMPTDIVPSDDKLSMIEEQAKLQQQAEQAAENPEGSAPTLNPEQSQMGVGQQAQIMQNKMEGGLQRTN